MISFTVPGNPVAQPRVKARKAGNFIQIYTPDKKVKPYKEAIKLVATQAMVGRKPMEGPLSVAIFFYIDRPKSHTKKQREQDWHAQKPDLDNLAKAVLDALKEVTWSDDSQIAELQITKQWAYIDPACTQIYIEKIPHG